MLFALNQVEEFLQGLFARHVGVAARVHGSADVHGNGPLLGRQKQRGRHGIGVGAGISVEGPRDADRQDDRLGPANQQMDARLERQHVAVGRAFAFGKDQHRPLLPQLGDNGLDAVLADAFLVDGHRIQAADEPSKNGMAKQRLAAR